jgi:two-component system nitrate/nitrite response regulator NarL
MSEQDPRATAPSSSRPIRILLVDDHVVVRRGLHLLLGSDAAIRVVGETGDRAGTLRLVEEGRPDLVLLDLDLGSESGADLIGEIRARSPDTRVLILTGVRDTLLHRRAIQLGASGVVEKEAAPEILLKAIRKVHEGEVWLDRAMTAQVLTEMSDSRRAPPADPDAAGIAMLSPREIEVIELLGEGLSNRRIADRLCISETTVRHHLSSVFSKLNVRDRLELLLFAHRKKLITLPPPS